MSDETSAPVVRPAAGAVARPSRHSPLPEMPEREPEELPSMSLLEHLEELRSRGSVLLRSASPSSPAVI